MRKTYGLMAALGSTSAPVTGPVEVVAVQVEGATATELGGPPVGPAVSIAPWPLAWSIRELAAAPDAPTAPLRARAPRVVEGNDASLLRTLRDRSVRNVLEQEVFVREGDAVFALYVRDQLPLAFAQALRTFPEHGRAGR